MIQCSRWRQWARFVGSSLFQELQQSTGADDPDLKPIFPWNFAASRLIGPETNWRDDGVSICIQNTKEYSEKQTNYTYEQSRQKLVDTEPALWKSSTPCLVHLYSGVLQSTYWEFSIIGCKIRGWHRYSFKELYSMSCALSSRVPTWNSV